MTTFVGPNGQGKTNLVEARRLRRDAVQPPGRHRPAAGPVAAPSRRSSARPWSREGRETLRRARAQPGQGQPGAGQPGAAATGPRRARPAAHRAVRPRGPRPGQGRPGRAARVPRRPAGAAPARAAPAVRADYDRVLKQRNALLKYRPCCAGRRSPAASRRERDAAHPRRLGRPPGRGSAPSCSPRRLWCCATSPRVAAAYEAVARGSAARRAWPTGASRGGGGPVAAGECPTREQLRELLAALARRPHRTRSSAASRLVGPHRDDLVLTPRRAAGQGLRQPRRVVVVRARAAAGRLRAAAHATRRATRSSSSTTSSPSSTPAAATGWPSWSPTASRSSSPRPSAPTCRARSRTAGRRTRSCSVR